MRFPLLPPLLAFSSTLLAAELPADYRFKVETLFEGIAQPMQLKLASDGRIFFNEYLGALKVYHPDTKALVEAGRIDIFNGQENGFLGFALDPKFAQNGWIYCLYSPKGFDGQHLSRFTMTGDQLDLASEKILLKFSEQRKECCHHAGSLHFGPDGCLYFSTGDNTHPHADSGGYGPMDERPDRSPWDAQKSASNTNVLNGKICRIRPLPDGTYEIPQGNLFKPGTAKTRPEIYVMGCRNPWRMNVDPQTGYVYWGEVGPDARDNGPRGPRGYDEVNQAKRPGNFGWPYFVGNNFAYAHYNYVTKAAGPLYDPKKPTNDSPNNTGLRELPPAQPAMIYWPYADSPEFPEMGTGGRTACAGPVFHWKAGFEKTNGLPREYDGWLLFWDWERPAIRWAKLDAKADFQGTAPFTSAVVVANRPEQMPLVQPLIDDGAALLRRPVDAAFGPDGCLYLLDYGETWGVNRDAKLVKISYLRENIPPVAVARADKTAGREPLTVQLSAAASRDRDGKIVSYDWQLLGDGQPALKASGEQASLTVPTAGNFRVELRVTDDQGATGTTMIPLTVGNTPPTVRFDTPRNGDFFTPGTPVKYAVSVSDAEDGDSAAQADLFGFRTLVSSRLLDAGGKDTGGDPGLSLMKSSDCFNCHQVDQKVVGPALLDIAEKYRGQPAALDASVKRVREGSTGVWGQVAMLPHQQHTTDEVTIMLRWVFGLQKGKGGPVLLRGLTGEIVPPKDAPPGTLVLEANYTDGGRPPVGSLPGQALVALRSRRMEAESGEVTGARILASGGSGKKCVGAIADRHFIKFAGMNLADTGSVTVRVSSGGVGGKIEVRVGSPTGTSLGDVPVGNSGGWDVWKELATPLFGVPKEPVDIYVVFSNPGKSGLMNLDWVQFNPK